MTDTAPMQRIPHIRIQLVAFAMTYVTTTLAYALVAQPPSFGIMTALTGVLAYLGARRYAASWHLQLLHFSFCPALYLAQTLNTPPFLYLVVSITLFLFFQGSVFDKVPLYLTNQRTTTALARFISAHEISHLTELGAGIGSVCCMLCDANRAIKVDAVENALGSAIIGALRCCWRRNIRWHYKNMWQFDLSNTDLVYAFLSPAPMPKLWSKLQAEMKRGSWLISNSFPIEGIAPDFCIEVNDRRKTVLYCYQIGTTAGYQAEQCSPLPACDLKHQAP